MHFSDATKNSIKFGGAALGASVAGYLLYANQKEKDYKGIGIIAAVAGALAFVILNAIVNAIDDATQKPDRVPLPGDTDTSGNTVDASAYDPKPLTDALYEDIYEVWGVRDFTPYQTLVSLSDTNFVQVYNDWRDRYWDKDHETLRVAINGEYSSELYAQWSGLIASLNARFDKLNLN